MKWPGWFGGILLLTACSGDLPHDASFDPDSPPEKQAKSLLTGGVALSGESDSAGVNIQLQSEARTYSVDTGADGVFKLTGVVPGAYSLRIGTRYFEENQSTITFLLGESVDLGTITLAPLTADVRGSALVEDFLGTTGGALLNLRKTGSVRAPAGAPASFAGHFGLAAETVDEPLFYTTVADSSGEFQLSGVDAGVYELTATTEDAAPVVVGDVTVTGEDGTVTVEPITLAKVSGAFSIAATVDGIPNFNYSDSPTVSLTLIYYGAESVDIGESASGQAAGCDFTRTVSVAASVAHTLSGSGTRHVCVRFVDAVGNTSETALSSIIVDGDAPSGGVAFNGGAAYITDPQSAYLSFTASDAGSGVAQLKVTEPVASESCTAALSRTAAEAYTSVRLLPLAAARDGVSVTICALFRDGAGNWMATPVSDTVVVDDVAPLAGTVSIDSAAAYATSTFVTLTLAATGASEMRVANGASVSSASWEPFRSSVSWFLDAAQGNQTVTVDFRDAAGNTTLTSSDTIELDSVAPASPSLSVVNANALGFVTSTTAQLSLFAVGAAKMQISRDGFFDAEPLQDYATAATMFLSGGEGVKLLYARFLDLAGNASPVVATSVVLDTALPQTGFLTINDGAAWTTSADIELAFTATGADEVAIDQGSCPTSGWQTYASQIAQTLTGADNASITVYARFRDLAGNTTQCISGDIGMDRVLTAPAFAAVVTGEEGISGSTARLNAWITVSGITADVSEIQIDDDSAFGGAVWAPAVTKIRVPLSKGDGTKTAFVRIRDLAGNTSAASSPSIELDQTGPDAPSLVVLDHTGDGHAVTESEVEIVWSKPSDAFGFRLERFVLGVSNAFAPLGALQGASIAKYTDNVLATTGNTHLYRIRALDQLGNYSNYSVAVAAYPFRAVERVFKINTSQGFRYFFTPNSGTFSLRPTYDYVNVDNDAVTTSLVENTVEWVRPLPTQDIFQESLTLRASSQDGSLVYDTLIPLGHNLREKLDYSNRGWDQRIAADVTGAAHIVASNFNGLNYATNKSGAWVSTVTYDGAFDNVDRHASIAVDFSGNPHIAYYADQKPRYRTQSTAGAWTEEVIDAAVITGKYTDIALNKDGIPSVVYYDETRGNLKYAQRSAGWVTDTVDAAGDVGQFARLALDSAGKAHIVYYGLAGGSLMYATNKSGPWVVSTLDGMVSTWTDIVVGHDDRPRIVYTKSNNLIIKSFDGAVWQTETLMMNIVASYVGIAMDPSGYPAVAFFDETTFDLVLARSVGGSWMFDPIHTAADPGRYVSLAYDGLGDLHLGYADDGAVAGYTRIVAPRVPSLVPEKTPTDNTGFAGSAVLGPRDAIYAVDWNVTTRELIFRSNRTGPMQSEVVTAVTNTPYVWNRALIAVRASGAVFIVYNDPDTGGLRCVFRGANQTNWSFSYIDSDPDAGAWPSLAIGPDQTVWVTYRYGGSGSEVRFSRRKNTTWTAPAVLDSSPWGWSSVVPIGFKPNGTVVVYSPSSYAWFESPQLTASTWGPFVVNPAYQTAPDPAFTFDSAGKIHVAWRDAGRDLLVYSTDASGTWTTEDVSATGLPDVYTTIRLDNEAKVHIVYYDSEYQAVRYGTNATGEWIAVTLDSGPKVGKFLSSMADFKQRSFVFYYDEYQGRLKSLFDFSGWIEPTSISLSETF